jgi:hypothetical protein
MHFSTPSAPHDSPDTLTATNISQMGNAHAWGTAQVYLADKWNSYCFHPCEVTNLADILRRFLSRNLGRSTLAVALCAAVSIVTVYADWGPWQTIGDGFVKVRFNQVSSDTCTWRIRNSGSTTLTRLDFSYKYSPAENPSSQRTEKDVLPYPLKRGEVVGGLTVYSAFTRKCPATLDVLKLERDTQ